MITFLIEIIRSWTIGFQFLFLVIASLFVTILASMLIQLVSMFVNDTIPTIIRGYPPAYDDDEDTSDEADDEDVDDDESN